MGTDFPVSEDVGEMATVADITQQHSNEETFVVDELLGTLWQAEGGDVDTINGPYAVGKAQDMKPGDNLVQVTETNDAVCQHVLDEQVYLLDCCFWAHLQWNGGCQV